MWLIKLFVAVAISFFDHTKGSDKSLVDVRPWVSHIYFFFLLALLLIGGLLGLAGRGPPRFGGPHRGRRCPRSVVCARTG